MRANVEMQNHKINISRIEMMTYIKPDGVLSLSVGSTKMFNGIKNYIKKALSFDSAEGSNVDTTVDGGVNVEQSVLSIPNKRRIEEREGDFQIDVDDQIREDGYSANDSEIDPSGTRNAKQW